MHGNYIIILIFTFKSLILPFRFLSSFRYFIRKKKKRRNNRRKAGRKEEREEDREEGNSREEIGAKKKKRRVRENIKIKERES